MLRIGRDKGSGNAEGVHPAESTVILRPNAPGFGSDYSLEKAPSKGLVGGGGCIADPSLESDRRKPLRSSGKETGKSDKGPMIPSSSDRPVGMTQHVSMVVRGAVFSPNVSDSGCQKLPLHWTR